MTLLQAFKAACEFGYSNDDLYNKILIDRGLTSSGTYSASSRGSIDMCLIDLYTYLKTHPIVQDGNTRIEYKAGALAMAIYKLAARNDLGTTELIGLGLGADVNGEAAW